MILIANSPEHAEHLAHLALLDNQVQSVTVEDNTVLIVFK